MEAAEAERPGYHRDHRQESLHRRRRENQVKHFRSTIVARFVRAPRPAPDELPFRVGAQQTARATSWRHSRKRSEECSLTRRATEARRCERDFHYSGRRVPATWLPRVTSAQSSALCLRRDKPVQAVSRSCAFALELRTLAPRA